MDYQELLSFSKQENQKICLYQKVDGVVEFGADYKAKRRIRVVSQDEGVDPVEYYGAKR